MVGLRCRAAQISGRRGSTALPNQYTSTKTHRRRCAVKMFQSGQHGAIFSAWRRLRDEQTRFLFGFLVEGCNGKNNCSTFGDEISADAV
jgi:hypothetical protein